MPFTGVIYVMAEAAKRGYTPHHPDWCNLGQGQPETGPLPGAPPRVGSVSVSIDDLEYAPVNGIPELREAVAELYNALYRRGMKSQYTAENVCICGGGRLSLTRTVAALGSINLGHFLPDYTAYEELLEIFREFTAIPILLDPSQGYRIGIEALEREVLGRGLGALLLSNPFEPHRQGDRRARARSLGGPRARDAVHAAVRRVLLALRVDGHRRTAGACCRRRAT